ncbi:MAG: methyltransferase type 11, partial [Myxococcota bacterium]
MNTTYRDDVHSWVQDYYGQVLKSSSDLKTNACCAVPPPGWIREPMSHVHPEVLAKFYGCGFPVPE